MSNTSLSSLTFLLLLTSIAACSPISVIKNISASERIFLLPQESAMFWPHQTLPNCSSYETKYSVLNGTGYEEYPELMTIRSLKINSTNDILLDLAPSQNQKKINCAKISKTGIVYSQQISETNILNVFEILVGKLYSHGMLTDSNDMFLYNGSHYLFAYFNFFAKKVEKIENKFTDNQAKNCSKISTQIIACFSTEGLPTLNLIELGNRQIIERKIQISTFTENLVSLNAINLEEGLFLVCIATSCSICRLKGTDKFEEVAHFTVGSQTILQSIFQEFNQLIVLATRSSLLVYNFYSYQSNSNSSLSKSSVHISPKYSIILQEQLNHSEFECVSVLKLQKHGDQFLLQCIDTFGEQINVVFLHDDYLKKYFSLRSHITGLLFLSQSLYSLSHFNFTVQSLNFYFLKISRETTDRLILVEISPTSGESFELQLNIVAANRGQIYVNKELGSNDALHYSQHVDISLKQAFKGCSMTQFYVKSKFGEAYVEVEKKAKFFSLYIREFCIKVLCFKNGNLYRVLKINRTVFYIEQCEPKQFGYSCQLFNILKQIYDLTVIQHSNSFIMAYYKVSDDKLYLSFKDQVIDIASILFGETKVIKSYKLIPSWGIELTVSAEQVYIVFLDWLIELRPLSSIEYKMMLKKPSQSYYYQEDCLMTVNPVASTVSVYSTSMQAIHQDQDVSTLQQNCFLFLHDGYLLLMNLTHLTKRYFFNNSLLLYEFNYNLDALPIASVKFISNFVVVQYREQKVQIYDVRQQLLALLIYRGKFQVIADLSLAKDGSLILPVKDKPYLIMIVSDPLLTVGPVPVEYSKMIEKQTFTVSPVQANKISQVTQRLNFIFFYNFIDIFVRTTKIDTLNLPNACSNCNHAINQSSFEGPVFLYYLGDEFDGQFLIRQHMESDSCAELMQDITLKKVQHCTPISQPQAIFVKGSSILFVNEQSQIFMQAQTNETLECLQYAKTSRNFLFFCKKYFYVIASSLVLKLEHEIDVDTNLHHYALQYSAGDPAHVYVSIDGVIIEVFSYAENPHVTLKLIDTILLDEPAFSLRVISQFLLTLSNEFICFYRQPLHVSTCYSLISIVPAVYSRNFQYTQIVALDRSILLMSEQSSNSHLELELTEDPDLPFLVVNAYAGYNGFKFVKVVAVKTQANSSYEHFIVQYENQAVSEILLCYYPFNDHYNSSGRIGHLKFAEFPSDVLLDSSNFEYVTYPDTFLLRSANLKVGLSKYRHCVQYSIHKELAMLMKYWTPPLVSYLIFHARNTACTGLYYTKIEFIAEQVPYYYALIGFGAVLVFFTAAAVALNQCRLDSQSQSLIEQSPQSSLIHSDSRPFHLSHHLHE